MRRRQRESGSEGSGLGMTTGASSWVVGHYDDYVTTKEDIPFFLAEAMRAHGPVLELMAGTGRVSRPLIKAGVTLTCIDISGHMVQKLRDNLASEGLDARVIQANVSRLDLQERAHTLAILPFQSFSELVTTDDQRATLKRVYEHLRPGGRFICTLPNPAQVRRVVDQQLRLLGSFPCGDDGRTLLLWSAQRYTADRAVVQPLQVYQIYDADERLQEQRKLEVRFRLTEYEEFANLAEAAGFHVVDTFGTYAREPYRSTSSPTMIVMLER